ncbi:hypothetical protein PUNSTDRAFT_133264 [Punctularia strigosozonata HHB-11173 SS5]|uniref:uncharacterized protein n=1 Tax=Punctularia strigosozonata (strain HHB-11173) TaxID=741275 RepID=UPI00044168C1|nr:uncharacterized protein PUNSTDRAFT_133264 [Punctularia strigosozonata HHB-11173 SS5]EIN09472.1 hypothetical protein PUNSTDRAFT_133264 [Punctularia strigosozonata HHB-11173 SS5]
MFRGAQTNAYDEIVAKTTDENLTGENWELILNLCDKVTDEGEQGARNVVAAILKRLAHRNANVQLYALTLAEALTKNCGIVVHREIASRAFTQGLEKIITDRTTHDKVRKRALSLIAMWTAEFEHDPSLGIMEECYHNLQAKNYKFETPQEAPPPDVDDEIRRREEEELQRVLEMSVQDKGGRGNWAEYSAYSAPGAGSSSGAGPSGSSAGPSAASSSSRFGTSSSSYAGPSSAAGSSNSLQDHPEQSKPSYAAYSPAYSGGYAPAAARSPSPVVPTPTSYTSQTTVGAGYSIQTPVPTSTTPAPADPVQPSASVVTRVRALHTFETTEPGELAFGKGDIIKVVDRGYKDWWRGQLKGRTGIFPVNYVEPLPEPTPAELAREAEQEAAVFAQAANVDRLLTMLREMEKGNSNENLADNEEIQELYRTSMALRPKIVKLIDKYSQKRADLVSMNETFVKSKAIYDRMMEESMARVDAYARPGYRPSQYATRPEPHYGGHTPAPAAPQAYGWNANLYDQPGYNAYPAPAQAYPPGHEGTYPTLPAQSHVMPQQQPSAVPPQGYDPNLYQQPPVQNSAGYAPSYGPGPTGQSIPQQPAPYPTATPGSGATGTTQPQGQAQPGYGGPAPGAYGPGYAQNAVQLQQAPLSQGTAPGGPQPAVHSAPGQQPQLEVQQPNQAHTQPQQQAQGASGPPYAYDPNTTYADPNVQAWAQYYAQGGKDPTGAVYFLSVPGVKEGPPPADTASTPASSATVHPQPAMQNHPGVVQPASPQGLREHSLSYGSPSEPQPLESSLSRNTSVASTATQHSLAHNLPPIEATSPLTPSSPYSQSGGSPPVSQPSIQQFSYGAAASGPPGGAPGYAAAPQSPTQGSDLASQQGWHTQYQTVTNQMANIHMGSELGQTPGSQPPHSPPPGVGASA